MVPPDRRSAILALLRAQDRLPRPGDAKPVPDLVTEHRQDNLGVNKALQLCLESADEAGVAPGSDDDVADSWAGRFLRECGRLAEAEMVLSHCESGFMRIIDDGSGTFDAWIATRRAPASWRERADFGWWAAWLAKRQERELRALHSERSAVDGSGAGSTVYHQIAEAHLASMAYQLDYPPSTMIGGCTIQTYRDIVRHLIGMALQDHDSSGTPEPRSEQALIATLASALSADPAIISQAIAAITLDRGNAAYHAAVPGIAAAPLVRIDPDHLAWSVRGLTSEPLLFLTRELRRRDAQEYHNTAYLRETAFRNDLYTLFQNKRFVTSDARIQLRRAGGDIRTDIDAVVFDRKTGTLGVFELKSQDPFARSSAELTRRRDNVLYANRQISGVLDWLKRHGGDALLSRVDARTAKTFRVQKVYAFVLGRYLVHFSDGPEPDRRAAWGSWPGVLRLTDGDPFGAANANPLAWLFARLSSDTSPILPAGDCPPRELQVGSARVIVHRSYGSFQDHNAAARGSS
ncbi:MAG TPA: hypothetical protein VGR08_08805 [Thermomicrobiales bacterium]|nr:hypothetical protein [Thermomicrobiales bacterium]